MNRKEVCRTQCYVLMHKDISIDFLKGGYFYRGRCTKTSRFSMEFFWKVTILKILPFFTRTYKFKKRTIGTIPFTPSHRKRLKNLKLQRRKSKKKLNDINLIRFS